MVPFPHRYAAPAMLPALLLLSACGLSACQGVDTETSEPAVRTAPGSVAATYDTVAGTVHVSWSPVPGKTIAGYTVYRSEGGASAMQPAHVRLIQGDSFVDPLAGLEDSLDYRLLYRVEAQDSSGNAGPLSDTVAVRTLAPLRLAVSVPERVEPGAPVPVQGWARSGLPLTSIQPTLWRGDSDVTIGHGFSFTLDPLPAGRKYWELDGDAGLLLSPDTAASQGRYCVRIEARAGPREARSTDCFEYEEGLSRRTLQAGAQNSTVGAFIDLDAFQSHTQATASPRWARIDLVFAYSSSAHAAAIYAPYTAKNGVGGGAGFDFAARMDPANATEIRMASFNPALLRSQAEVDALWKSAPPVPDGRLLAQKGLTFLAKSERGLVVALHVTGLTADPAGTVDFEGAAKF